MHSIRRFLPFLLLVAALIVAGCGSDSSGPDTSDPNSTASVSDDSPLSILPADAPLAVSLSTDLDGGQLKDALSFAQTFAPAGMNLRTELVKSIDDDLKDKGQSFDGDVKPWLGKTAALYFDDFSDDGAGAFVLQTTDAGKAKAFIDKQSAADKAKPGSYAGTTYTIDPDDDSVSGIVGDFLVGASDEAHFKAVVDASKGDSLTDGDKYKTAVGRLSSSDNLAVGYVDVDAILAAVAASGAVPQSTLDQVKKNPAYKPGETVAAALDASTDKMSIETAGNSAELSGLEDADVSDLAGDAWLAFTAPIDGQNLADGFQEGIKSSGADPQITSVLDGFGISDFLGGLKGISLRLGGESLTSINGSLKIQGDDEDATKKIFDTAVGQAQSAGAGQVQIKVDGNTATAVAGPYSVKLTADGGDLSLTFGDEPSSKLSDLASFKDATGDLDGGKPLMFVDFAPIAALVKTIPGATDDPQTEEVLGKLGTLILGSEIDGDTARAKAVLTLAG